MNREVKSGSHKPLFLDDDIVQDLQGLRRVLNRPVKHPEYPRADSTAHASVVQAWDMEPVAPW